MFIVSGVNCFCCCLIFGGLNVLRLQVLECGHRHVGNQSVQFVGRVLIVVAATRQAHTNAEWR